MMVPRRYLEALDRACARAHNGEARVVELHDGHVRIEVDKFGFVCVALMSPTMRDLFDDWHIECSDRSEVGAPSGGIPQYVLMFKQKRQ